MTPEMVALIGRAIWARLTRVDWTLNVEHDPAFGWYVWPDGEMKPHYEPRLRAAITRLREGQAAA